jgi:hypothetical protein
VTILTKKCKSLGIKTTHVKVAGQGHAAYATTLQDAQSMYDSEDGIENRKFKLPSTPPSGMPPFSSSTGKEISELACELGHHLNGGGGGETTV